MVFFFLFIFLLFLDAPAASLVLLVVLSKHESRVCHPSQAQAEINKETLIECSSPRKSLVKGERFVRSEEKPELELRIVPNLCTK